MGFKKLFFNRWMLLLVFLIISISIFYNNSETKNLIDCYYSITMWMVIYTAFIAAYDFNERKNENKLNYSIKLSEYFDNEELRKVRDLTRALREDCQKGEVANATLLALIKREENDKAEELAKNCGLKYPAKDLERSLVYLFNYWQRVYSGLKYNAVNEKYIYEHLGSIYKSHYERFKCWIDNNLKAGDKIQYEDLEKFYDLTKKYTKNMSK